MVGEQTLTIPLGTCDRHPSANAATMWEHDALTLTLCSHCHNRNTRALLRAGWTVAHIDTDWRYIT